MGKKRIFLHFCIVFILVVISIFLSPQSAAGESTQAVPLTLELLQQRIDNPIIKDGNFTIDLRHTQIDLRQESSSFNREFYRLLRKELQKTGVQPLALDLSSALVLGNFAGSELGLRTPLYSQAIAPVFTLLEQEQLQQLRSVCLRSLVSEFSLSQDCRSLVMSNVDSTDINVFRGSLIANQTHFIGKVDFSKSFFLQPVDFKSAVFEQESNWNETRFARKAQFSQVKYESQSSFKGSVFLNKVRFKESLFTQFANFQSTHFLDLSDFSQAVFQDNVNFRRGQWWRNGNFSDAKFLHPVIFSKANFDEFIFFNETTFAKAVTFRETNFNQPVILKNASILDQADFSDTVFNTDAYLYVPGLSFNSNFAKILGNPGEIGIKLRVPYLQGNANVIRNLVQNFRQLQQISDANHLDYIKQKLLLRYYSQNLFGNNLNNISAAKLIRIGFSEKQAQAIIKYRNRQNFKNKRELLKIISIDYQTYTQTSLKIIAEPKLSPRKWFILLLKWIGLILLLIFTGFGTSFWLIIGIGIIATTYFGVLFWICDRFGITTAKYEILCILISSCLLNTVGLVAIFKSSSNPLLTCSSLLVILFPVPGSLIYMLYTQGYFHTARDSSYFREDGSMRQLRLLIGNLPIIPRYPMFRERFMPLLWERRWNWLNYYDFSLSNLLKIGFNDIRLRDKNLPSFISVLAWYQWSLGMLYITLLLWTLSRTIPGLNLLIYLK